MGFQFVAGFLLIGSNVAIHFGLTGFFVWRLRPMDLGGQPFAPALAILAHLVVWCVIAHVIEIVIWAVFYDAASVMPDIETASYFSAVTYATIGYGDITPPQNWRLLASMEGVTGILMCAWSGGLIFTVVSQMVGGRPK